jgi:hypothetical protein
MHTAVSFLLAGPRPGCNGFLAPRGVMGCTVRLATDSPWRGGIDDAAGQKDCSCPKDSWPTGCDRKQGLPRRLRTGVGTVAVYPLRTEVRGTPNHADESHQLVLPDGGTRGPGRLLPDRCRRPSTSSARPAQMQNGFLSENPEPCRPTDRDNRSDGWSRPSRRAGEESGAHQRQNHRDCSLAKS